MAKSAAVSLASSTAHAGQSVSGQVTFTNGDIDPVLVTNVQVFPATPHKTLTIDQPDIGAGGGAGLGPTNAVRPNIANGSGTKVFPFRVVATQPQRATPAGSGLVGPASTIAYVLKAQVDYSDGSTVTTVLSSTATLTVSPPT